MRGGTRVHTSGAVSIRLWLRCPSTAFPETPGFNRRVLQASLKPRNVIDLTPWPRYSARCRVCNFPHRVQIGAWAREDDLPPRAISVRSVQEFHKNTGRRATWQHLREHLCVKVEVREEHRRSQACIEKAVERGLSGVEVTNPVAKGGFDLHKAACEQGKANASWRAEPGYPSLWSTSSRR